MNDLQTLLRDGDPVRGDDGLTPAQVEAMRRQILNAARQPDVVTTPWQQPLAVAAMVALTVAAGVTAGTWLPAESPAAQRLAPSPADEPRQLQFSTPGGTRIIWVFDPEFAVKETLP